VQQLSTPLLEGIALAFGSPQHASRTDLWRWVLNGRVEPPCHHFASCPTALFWAGLAQASPPGGQNKGTRQQQQYQQHAALCRRTLPLPGLCWQRAVRLLLLLLLPLPQCIRPPAVHPEGPPSRPNRRWLATRVTLAQEKELEGRMPLPRRQHLAPPPTQLQQGQQQLQQGQQQLQPGQQLGSGRAPQQVPAVLEALAAAHAPVPLELVSSSVALLAADMQAGRVGALWLARWMHDGGRSHPHSHSAWQVPAAHVDCHTAIRACMHIHCKHTHTHTHSHKSCEVNIIHNTLHTHTHSPPTPACTHAHETRTRPCS